MKIEYQYPYFEDFVEPKGALKIDKACHACFQYAMLAMQARSKAGKIESQIIAYKVGDVEPEWHETRDEEIARSVAIIYALESPDEFLKYKAEVWLQAEFLGYHLDVAIFDVRPGGKVIH